MLLLERLEMEEREKHGPRTGPNPGSNPQPFGAGPMPPPIGPPAGAAASPGAHTRRGLRTGAHAFGPGTAGSWARGLGVQGVHVRGCVCVSGCPCGVGRRPACLRGGSLQPGERGHFHRTRSRPPRPAVGAQRVTKCPWPPHPHIQATSWGLVIPQLLTARASCSGNIRSCGRHQVSL